MAEKIRRKVKRNNNGSTMVIVLIMLSFIMILATVVTSSTIMNLKMKVADKQSTKTFYTSEDAVNEVYVAMGQVSADCFNKAYQDEIAEVVESTAAGNMTVDNITCNENLRLNYAHRILNKLGFIKDSDLEGIKHTYSDYVSKKQEGTFVRAGNTVEGLGVADALNKCIEDTHKDAVIRL
jgi:biopolymer transport protein ExbD